MATISAPSTKVKRYYCLYSSQFHKKSFIRHHHLNSRLYLLSVDNQPLAESFYCPPRNQPCLFDDGFTLEDQELDFNEQGFSVQVGELESERNVDLGAIQAQTRTAKKERLAAAKQWALESSGADSNRSTEEQNARAGFRLQDLTTTSTRTSDAHLRYGSASSRSPASTPLIAASSGKARSSMTSQANARPIPYSKDLTPARPSSTITTADHLVAGAGHTPPTQGARAEFKPPRPSRPPGLKSAY
ncbi:BQ2448_1331 [Microbotryum intermedium]|uniref:BQ2448_1331 protein n=1 Tax=Microbotryum intermedium TaxID=269621 RepID=A0A238F9V9_9BASI|nr:BQ2448_1331 [Microbotryum intermedium]